MLMQQAIRVLAEQWMLKTDESKEYWWYVEILESSNLKEIIAEIYKNCNLKNEKLEEQLNKFNEILPEYKSKDAEQTKNENVNPKLRNNPEREKRRLELKKKITELTKEIEETIPSKKKDMEEIQKSYQNPKLIKAESYMNAFLKYIDPTCEDYVKSFLKMRRSRKM
jgi:transposase